ncbi:ATP-binding cassette domain-containing protein [Lactococcus hircilactis]|uniref:ATP-binding cassette domain-containing protein n=1 Tax=Lactococcus hircilactis TaxID=1494462 RepID=A0A7X2CZT4_9LACT|nr:ABC transporter ATP-binding protein [Lactococcus hircilactis]MQW38526.1 ATP-binding cassette domain-containing protein [Lactococcus hircilactis]
MFIEVRNIKKEYKTGNVTTAALDNVSFSLEEGTFNVVLGPSGSGKTTLLNMLGGMDWLTEGEIKVGSAIISKMKERELTNYRRKTIGFVFQFYNIIPSLNVFENVQLVENLGEESFDAKEILSSVGLKNRMQNFPQDLSGGELQRVSIARAICKNPQLLLCDEPTGALDSKTGQNILQLLKDMAIKYKKTVIVVTHNATIAEVADNVIHIKDGILENFEVNSSPKQIDEIAW